MTKEQLSQLVDEVRIPTEILLERLTELSMIPHDAAISDSGGIAFLFEATKGNLTMTADIEIDHDGTVTASVIPYVKTPAGLDVYVNKADPDDNPIQVWEVEEPPPFDETILLIRQLLGLLPAES